MQTKRRQIKFLEKKEVEKIIDTIPTTGYKNLRDRALIEVLFSTGMRISEALKIQIKELANISSMNEPLELAVIGKGGWQRVVFFSPQALKAVKKYFFIAPLRDNQEALFPITIRGARYMVKRRAKQAGIDKPVSPHVFRHSLATDLLRKGVDISFVSKFLGHRSLNNTMIYAHIVDPQLLAIHKKLYK